MSSYEPAVYESDVLDILARAYDRALDALPRVDTLDRETARAVLLTGILDAAERGVRSEEELANSALEEVALFEQGSMDAAPAAGHAD
jgi:hypothetical protein